MDLQLCNEHGCLRRKQTRETTQAIWKSKCLPLLPPVCRKGNESPRSHTEASPSTVLPSPLIRVSAAPSQAGPCQPISYREGLDALTPNPQGMHACRAGGKSGGSDWRGPGGKAGLLGAKTPSHSALNPGPRPASHHNRPRSSSSSAFSRNPRASYNLDLVPAACEASSQRDWGTKDKAGCVLATPAPWLRCLTRGQAPL